MSNEDPNVTVAKFSFKQAIIVATITGITTLGVTLLTAGSHTVSDSTDESEEDSGELQTCMEQNENLNNLLESSISISSLADISDQYFSAEASSMEVKGTIRNLVQNANQYEKDSQHFMHKLFRLKKFMLANGGNINVRVSNANSEACMLIQDLLKGIEYYRGSVDGNVESTREAVEAFQRTLNQYTEGYFAEQNIGIVGKKTFNAILEHYERY